MVYLGLGLPLYSTVALMRPRSIRARSTLAAIALGAVGGLFFGYLGGREVSLRAAEARLDDFALHVSANSHRSAEEARSLLLELNRSPFAACSDAELEYFRKLVYTAEFLKDAGRMQSGAIQCSAVLGRLHAPITLSGGFGRPDGTRVYRDILPYRIPDGTVVAVQSGNALVVYSPYNLRRLDAPPMHFFISDRDPATGQTRHLASDLAQPDPHRPVFTREGTSLTRHMLYVTHCGSQYSSCLTTYMSVADAMLLEKPQFRLFLGLSTLYGALLGFGLSMMYRRNRSLEQQLRRAIRRGRLRAVFQPIFDLPTGRLVGAEALARWIDESGRAVSPEYFTRLAEERGFVGEITRAMVQHAAQALEKTAQAYPDFRITVNIAAPDLNDPGFLPMVRQTLASSRVAASCLGFEITENSWTEWQSANNTLARLRERGHVVYMDDFGTGYSGLAHLNHLPLDVLKIDKEFTQSVGTESVKVSILPQILSIALALQLQVVVEGIETPEQVQFFSHCNPPVMAQGWYFGRPMPLQDLLDLLEEDKQQQGFLFAQPLNVGEHED